MILAHLGRFHRYPARARAAANRRHLRSVQDEPRRYGAALAHRSETSGFLGCNGLTPTDDGEIFSVPALHALNAKAQLSHETSIGMIDQEKLSYLMASGMNEDQARDLIIQGFSTWTNRRSRHR